MNPNGGKDVASGGAGIKAQSPFDRPRQCLLAPVYVGAFLNQPEREYVNWECAIAELQALGVEFDELYLSRLRETIARDFQGEKQHVPITRWEFDAHHGIEPDSDENFAFIAGYTPGGYPYGVTWEEMQHPEH